MAIPTFAPVKSPILGADLGSTARVIEPSFGDGYSQVTIDGLNALSKKASLRWAGLTEAQKNVIEGQFITFSGTTFIYQLPSDASPLKWRCKDWTVNDTDGVLFQMTATFQQVFDLS